MQLIIVTLCLVILLATERIRAQVSAVQAPSAERKGSDSTHLILATYEKPSWKTIDVDFLSSYYQQDGNNSPVTGGLGTEALTDFTQKIRITIPKTERLSIHLDGGYDYYTSASTDRIDNIRSSDSRADLRTHGSIGLTYQWTDQQTIGARIGGSNEYDYTSITGGINYSLLSKDQNTQLHLSAQAFIDRWSVIYPAELRRIAQVPTNKRQSFNLSIALNQVLNRKMQIALMLEGIYMNGLLSTPFHRVYFAGEDRARIENLPTQRLKLPLGLRLNWHVTEQLIARTFYRYYWDDWGMSAHTLGLELPIKLSRFLAVYPHYRYHTQTAADWFQPYQGHQQGAEFYTSDFDLAELQSHTYGIGIMYSPAKGILRVRKPFQKNGFIQLKSLDLKYSHFDRSTGLQADIISLGLGISL